VGRIASRHFVLSNGARVGYSLKLRGDIYRVQFADPDEPGRYREVSTGYRTQNDAVVEAARIIVKAYAPHLPPDPKRVTWERVIAELEQSARLRPRSLEVYTSTINILRKVVTSRGPADVTAEVAKQFRRVYASTKFRRSDKDGAKEYPRSAKTVENAIRRLSGLWSHLKEMAFANANPWADIPRPTVPKKVPVIPTEDDVAKFFAWLDGKFPGWELPRLFVEVKALSGCRLNDLCQVRSDQLDPKARTLTIRPEQDKTHRERVIPLPDDLVTRLVAIRGPTYLWERYNHDASTHRKGTKSRDEFSPAYFYNAMKSLFRDYGKTGGKLRSHGLRKRAITLTTLATQSVDATAQAIGIDAQTARKYYLDAQQAFSGTELLKQMADVLRLRKQEGTESDE
jgi:integrase